MRQKRKKKVKYSTVSLPRSLADDIQALINEYGYWPSVGAFCREAALEKLKKERQTPGNIVPVPILAFEPEEKIK